MAKQNLPSGEKTLLILVAKGYCYRPSCTEPLIVYRDGTPIVNFEFAHIRDELPPSDPDADIGWRYWPDDLSQEQRNRFENLILLCKNCHKLIDKVKPREFSVELLHEWKATHEGDRSTQLATSLNGFTVDQLEARLVNAIRDSEGVKNVSKLAAHYFVMHPLIEDFRFRSRCLFEPEHRNSPLQYQRMTNLYGPGEKITDEYPRKNALHYFFESQEKLQLEVSNLLKNIDLEDSPAIKDCCICFIKACQHRKSGDSALVYARARNIGDGSPSGQKWIEEFIKNSEGEPEFTENAIQNAYISVWKQLKLQLHSIYGIESEIAELTENR